MTPTLLGRWQTRLLLLGTIGVLLSLLFFLVTLNGAFFFVVFYVALFGMGWDVLYNMLQQWRWDHDWPAAFQVAAGVWEAIVIAVLFKTRLLPGVSQEVPLALFFVHYSLVWIAVFAASQTAMRVFFPRWRFRGGQWL
jgi:hypothetical protein